MNSHWNHFYTSKIEREVFRILRNIRVKETYMEKIKLLYRVGERVVEVKKLRIIGDDPDDDKYLECAEKCLADYIITNDRHLLKLKSFQRTEIVRPVEFFRKSST